MSTARMLPPRSFRSDTVGVFAVLGLAGVSSLVTRVPGSVADQVNHTASVLWAVTLAVAGLAGLVTCYVPRRYALPAAGVHVGCRVALAFGCLTYSVAVTAAESAGAGRWGLVLVFLGLALMQLRAAWTLVSWLHRQRQLVEQVLAAQDGEGGRGS